jgi:hypothetical protein
MHNCNKAESEGIMTIRDNVCIQLYMEINASQKTYVMAIKPSSEKQGKKEAQHT